MAVDQYHSVTQSNHLIEASYRLTLNEQRLILACIAQLDPRKPMPKGQITVDADEFARTYSLSSHKGFEQLAEAANRLYERDLQIHDGRARARYRWVDHVKYHQGEGYVTVSFTQWVTPYLVKLSREFTSYRIGHVAGLQSTYAIRLYQLLIQYLSVGKREITVESLRERFELEDKYPRFNNLRARVINPAVRELNDKTNLAVQWEPHKEHRSVVALTFTFSERPQMSLDLV